MNVSKFKLAFPLPNELKIVIRRPLVRLNEAVKRWNILQGHLVYWDFPNISLWWGIMASVLIFWFFFYFIRKKLEDNETQIEALKTSLKEKDVILKEIDGKWNHNFFLCVLPLYNCDEWYWAFSKKRKNWRGSAFCLTMWMSDTTTMVWFSSLIFFVWGAGVGESRCLSDKSIRRLL